MNLLPTSKRGLWAAFFVFVVLNLVFLAVMQIYGFAIIDEMWKPAAIIDHVKAMAPVQRTAHAWLTGTADVAYPLTYAALFGGLAVAAFPDRRWLALPILFCVPADLLEGLSQVMILTSGLCQPGEIGEACDGAEAAMSGWVAVKAIATPIKLVLFVVGVLIGLAGLVQLIRRRKKPAA